MKKIITITLNPAFDLHYAMDEFRAGKENYVKSSTCDAGGKGINISRALLSNDVDNTAFVILGDENGAAFEQGLIRDGVKYTPLHTQGRIRENITIHPASGAETRISLDNFSLTDKTLTDLGVMLEMAVDEDTIIAFSGRNPKGVTKQDVMAFLKRLKDKGAKIAVDSNSFTPDDLMLIHPWFIKPNEQEIAAFLGREINDVEDAAARAKELVERGVAEEVMISMGGLGSAWSDGKRTLIVSVPKIENPVSTIGAGDSTVAGYIAATAKGYSKEDSLRLACAFGTSACMTEGTRPPMADDVKKVYDKVAVK
ncbi:MAG: 1-phosphofructokinase family hexose kinase [Ruminococcaceae bacterium]|nr:1-phosphofructokinase family hexose kinase [Oscillospiraceae bacterium]